MFQIILQKGAVVYRPFDCKEQAIAEPITLNPMETREDGIMAYPYFTSYVRSLLYNNYDLSDADILRGGLRVYTTLDVTAQQAAEAACQTKRDSMWDDSMEVAMAVVDPKTGNVQAIVGGSDYNASQVNIATGQGGGGRPCGSVFKTFTLVTAIKKGINPNSTYVDCSSPATVDGYTLENYGNASYGTRSIASAWLSMRDTVICPFDQPDIVDFLRHLSAYIRFEFIQNGLAGGE